MVSNYYICNMATVYKNGKSALPHLLIHLYIDKMISWLNLRYTKIVFGRLAL